MPSSTTYSTLLSLFCMSQWSLISPMLYSQTYLTQLTSYALSCHLQWMTRRTRTILSDYAHYNSTSIESYSITTPILLHEAPLICLLLICETDSYISIIITINYYLNAISAYNYTSIDSSSINYNSLSYVNSLIIVCLTSLLLKNNKFLIV
jgi:hypothetical protein